VRGLDYYNRTVVEWTTTRLGAQGTVCAGGRYDGLVEQIGGKPAPACGYAMGVERLLALMQEGPARAAPAPDVYVVRQGAAAERYAETLAEKMRDAGLAVVLHCGGGSFKSQMKKADSSGARYAAIVGDDEARAGILTLKALRTAAEQAKLPLAAAKAGVTTGEMDDAKKRLQWAADNAKEEEMRDLARLRLAGVLLDEKKYDEALKLLSVKTGDTFVMFYADLRGDVLGAQGKPAEARTAYQQALDKSDPNSNYRRLIELKIDALGEAK
jgi:histidyl-tRNA synthetase